MKKLQFCCGGSVQHGWECHDMDVDIRRPLPFPSHCASHIHIEHGIEHVTHQQAWNFLSECYRILGHNGRLRIAIPDVSRMWSFMTMGNGDCYKKSASKEGTMQAAIKAAIFGHGHQAAWNGDLLCVFLEAVGFKNVYYSEVGWSDDPELCHIEKHGKVVGEDVNKVETTVIEAVR